jgi:transaldolase
MALFLDSANPEDARRAQELGFIEGITTNPRLMAQTGRKGLEVLEELVEIFDGHVFYQVTAQTLEARLDEAWQAYEIRPDRVVIKIPAATENFGMIAKLPGVEIAITSVFSPAQAYLGVQAGVHYIIPYVNRATRLLGDGLALVGDLAQIVAGSETVILAASLKSVEEGLGALLAGAHHLTLPLELILAMGDHELSLQAIEEFKGA